MTAGSSGGNAGADGKLLSAGARPPPSRPGPARAQNPAPDQDHLRKKVGPDIRTTVSTNFDQNQPFLTLTLNLYQAHVWLYGLRFLKWFCFYRWLVVHAMYHTVIVPSCLRI